MAIKGFKQLGKGLKKVKRGGGMVVSGVRAGNIQQLGKGLKKGAKGVKKVSRGGQKLYMGGKQLKAEFLEKDVSFSYKNF